MPVQEDALSVEDVWVAIGEVLVQARKQSSETIAQEENLFLNMLDTQFIAAGTPIGFAKRGYLELCFHDDQPHREKSVCFIRDCFR